MDFRVSCDGPDLPDPSSSSDPAKKKVVIDALRVNHLFSFARKVLPHSIGKLTDDADLAVRILVGGTSNQLYHVYAKSLEGTTDIGAEPALECVVRVFGEALSDVVDREAEFFWQQHQLPTYGRCHNALAYQFLRGSQNIGVEAVRTHVDEVCGNLAAFHFDSINTVLPESMQMRKRAVEEQRGKGNDLFSRTMLQSWVERATSKEIVSKLEEKYGKDNNNNNADCTMKKKKKLEFVHRLVGRTTAADDKNDYEDIHSAAQELLGFIDSPALRRFHVVVPSCHNDLNVLNIMVPADRLAQGVHPLPVKFIDYEYCGENYAVFDIGNHMNEWAGLEANYALFPTEREQMEIVAKYMKGLVEARDKRAAAISASSGADCRVCNLKTKRLESEKQDASDAQHEAVPHCYCALLAEYEAASADHAKNTVLTGMRVASLLHALVSHVGWVCWSLFQQAGSQISFSAESDYVDYAMLRHAEYVRLRKVFLDLMKHTN